MAGAAGAGARGGPPGCLAIVAGRGALPRRLAEARAEAGLPYLLIVFPDCEEPWMLGHPLERHAFERAGRLFASLRRAGVEAVVFAGAMNRPRLRPWRADWTALRLLGRALRLMAQGDDAMLRGFGAVFEARGLRLISPAEVLGEALSLPAGPLGRLAPGAEDLADAARAAAILDALGTLDVGQGVVVARGICLAVEAIEGTDLMLARVATLPAERRRTAAPPSGVLFKAPKSGQDRRFDLPAIGPATVESAARAGLKGIVAAAGETQLLDAEATRAAADRL
ncbi:MAG: UDP-2,3-diacylglucosamine diphosphatase LpxI, partial [Thermohalobaculum sp.]|nr:UDP-2,3-diacylglucosamine diphosphatase LpxI [Thermohalobaculum sp.]